MQMKSVKFLEGNNMSFFCRMSGKYLTFKPHEVQEVAELTADELVKTGRFEYVTAKTEDKAEEKTQEKKGRKKK